MSDEKIVQMLEAMREDNARFFRMVIEQNEKGSAIKAESLALQKKVMKDVKQGRLIAYVALALLFLYWGGVYFMPFDGGSYVGKGDVDAFPAISEEGVLR